MSLGNLTLNPGVGGSDLPIYSDSGSRKWVGGVTAWLVSAGSPDTIQTVDLTHGLPVQPQTGSTWAVSAASLPLPAGAATAANQATANAALATANTSLASVAGATGLPASEAPARAVFVAGEDGGGLLRPLSVDAQGNVSVVPGDVFTVTGTITGITNPVAVTGTFWQATQPVSGTVTANAGTGTFTIQSNASVNVAQVGGSALALGQQLAAASVPVVLTAAQVTTLTPPSTVAATQSGTWNLATVTTLTGITNVVHVDDNSGSLTVDAPVGTPVFVRLSDGTAAVGTGHGTAAAALRVELPTDGTGVIAGVTTVTTVTTVAAVTAITNALPAGTNLLGKVGVDQTTPGTTNGVTPVPAASGGPTASRVKSAAGTNATNLKASAGQVYGWALFNNTASAKYLKFYNSASAPTAGSGTPAFTVLVPANSGANVEFSMGVPFGTGVGYTITGAITDADTTATAADDVHGVILWK